MNFNKQYWARVCSAHVILTIIDWVLDNPIYLWVIAKFGSVNGGLIMTLASMVWCASFIIIYECKKTDWLGVDAVEAVKKHGARWIKHLESWNIVVRAVVWLPSRMFLVVLWMIQKNDCLAFIALSIYEDPFKTVAFLRKGRFNGLGFRDLMVFGGSVILSNGYWVVRNTILLEIGKLGWKQFIHN